MSNKKKKNSPSTAENAAENTEKELTELAPAAEEVSETAEAAAEEVSGEAAEKVSTPIEDLLKDTIKAQKNGEIKKAEKPSEDEDDDEEPEKPRKEKKHTNVKVLKHGMMSTVLTIVFVAAVVLVNVIATIIFERYPLTIDLTKEKKFSISEKSEEYIKNIDTDVLITVFSSEDEFSNLSDYTKQALEVIRKYKQYNDRISYRFIEIDSNPDIVSEYGVSNITQFCMMFETNPTESVKRTRKVLLTDLLKINDEVLTEMGQQGISMERYVQAYGDFNTFRLFIQGGGVEASRADEAFMSALMAVTDPKPTNAVFLTGRNESDQLAYLHTLLEANGYYVSDVDITKEEIPADTNLVIVPAPCTDYLPEEVDKLDKYLENGGALGKQMLYCASVQQQATPNLDEFLAEYGIKIGDGFVCEDSNTYYYTQPYETLTNYVTEDFLQDVSVSKDQIVLINDRARPIELLYETRGFNAVKAYVTSTESASVRSRNMIVNSEGQLDLETLSRGKQIYTAVASKGVFSENDAKGTYSNIVVFGSIAALSDKNLSYSQFTNREYILSLLNGVTNKTRSGVVIEPKVITGNVYDLTGRQRSVMQWTFILIIPVVVLIIGGVIWLRRKNR